jgi:hypothetical protein
MRGVDASDVQKKLKNDKQWSTSETKWYCAMNTWDETVASCAAPQEPYYVRFPRVSL